MSNVSLATPALPHATHPPAISLREIGPWALFAAVLVALVYVVGTEQGAAALGSGNLIHEWVHDGRHLLGFPCH
jgi:Probable cobalt transporter subunit (CbtB)